MNLDAKIAELVDGYGFRSTARSISDGGGRSRQAVLRKSSIELRLVEGLDPEHPARAYVERHGDGVADIALSVPDVARAFAGAVRRGASPVAPPAVRDGVQTASVGGFGDVTHTFVPLDAVRTADPDEDGPRLGRIDHFAVCVEAGQLDLTVDFYVRVLDFRSIFSERIVVGGQAMLSTVVQSAAGTVTFTIIAPDPSRDPGQIDDFLKNHDGAGVQHIAFTAGDIVITVREAQRRGVEFLGTPAAYYRLLTDHITLARHSTDELRDTNVLADEDEHGQLFQIFTRSVHPRGTFFFELIERFGARTFGSGNITALYEAVEAQRSP
ncbi:4-hydroxyphenylpyruvate dioxygenase [Actinocatenispora thailandica]|uniref:4-hydroxyphenylpyruvate dioxygenase n=1 Tax=Actinocatenispora thailandica TaxID=227318 RepID=UPI00194F4D3B|nr:4-hydroxyphenylpyruvate dioxygenase [Actinocatenispora thailandica]